MTIAARFSLDGEWGVTSVVWREPRNLEPRKLILEAESCLSRIFAPPKITRYTISVLQHGFGMVWDCLWKTEYCALSYNCDNVGVSLAV